MFGFFSSKKPPKEELFVDGEIERMTADAPPHVQALHMILEQGLVDQATEVLMQYDRFRNEFAVYFKRNESYEEVLSPPPSLFGAIQAMLVSAGHLRLPEDEGQFVFPRETGGRLRYSIAIEDEGATMALSMLGYC
jgi:hypothetical protein